MMNHKYGLVALVLLVVLTCYLVWVTEGDFFTASAITSSANKNDTNSFLFFPLASKSAEKDQMVQPLSPSSPSSMSTTTSLLKGYEPSSPSSSSSSGLGSNGTINNLNRIQGLDLPSGSTRSGNISSTSSSLPPNQVIKSTLLPAARQQQPPPPLSSGHMLSSSDQSLLRSPPPPSSTWYSSSSSSHGYPSQDQSFMQPQPSLPSILPFPPPLASLPSPWPPVATMQEQQPMPSFLQQQSSPSSSPSSSSLPSSIPSKKSSPWFPSIPASSCQGIFQFTIDGTAYLKKINPSQHNVTLQIESTNENSVSAKLWIDRKGNSDARPINFDIKNVENNCKNTLYTKSTDSNNIDSTN